MTLLLYDTKSITWDQLTNKLFSMGVDVGSSDRDVVSEWLSHNGWYVINTKYNWCAYRGDKNKLLNDAQDRVLKAAKELIEDDDE